MSGTDTILPSSRQKEYRCYSALDITNNLHNLAIKNPAVKVRQELVEAGGVHGKSQGELPALFPTTQSPRQVAWLIAGNSPSVDTDGQANRMFMSLIRFVLSSKDGSYCRKMSIFPTTVN